MIIGYAAGAYDLFHYGHLEILRKAKENCDYLIAGVVHDDVLDETKGRRPALQRLLQGRRLEGHRKGQCPGSTLRRGRRGSTLLPLHRAHLQHQAAQGR